MHASPALTGDRRTDRALLALARLLAEIATTASAAAEGPAASPINDRVRTSPCAHDVPGIAAQGHETEGTTA